MSPEGVNEISSATVMYMQVLAVYGKRFRFKYWKMSDACIQERQIIKTNCCKEEQKVVFTERIIAGYIMSGTVISQTIAHLPEKEHGSIPTVDYSSIRGKVYRDV